MGVVRFLKNRNGFSYVELMAGMSVLLLGVTFLIAMYRVSSQNRIIAREKTVMATVAQNMAEVYKATSGTDMDAINAAIAEAESEGYPGEKIDFSEPELVSDDKHDYRKNLYRITIRLRPRKDLDGIKDYVLEFYWVDKSLFKGN